MTRKPQTTPRKAPKQSRSTSLVESILTASTRVFEKLNYNKTTTNKIAEVAGVSIGSLYQYFPGKEAILRALIQERVNNQLSVLEQTLTQSHQDPLPETVEKLIRFIIEPAYKNKNISRIFYETGSFLGASEVVLESRQRATKIICASLRQKSEFSHAENLDVRVSILLNAILGSLAAAVIEPHERISAEQLVFELKALALSYLKS